VEFDTRLLFTVPPREFVATRDRLATAARDNGDPALAKRIRGLRRPTVSAWAVNLLAHRDATRLGRLLDVGTELRRAWAEGGETLEPGRRRSTLITELVRRAGELAADAGNPLREPAVHEVEETLNAATIDPAAAEDVRSGRLSHPLRHSGFAAPVLETAKPAAKPGAKPAAKPGTKPAAKPVPEPRDERSAHRQRLRRLVLEADNAAARVTTAERDRADRESELRQARDALATAEADLDRIRTELRAQEKDREAAARRVRRAEWESARAARSATTARAQADEAHRRLARERDRDRG
jgi:hypothetical protein